MPHQRKRTRSARPRSVRPRSARSLGVEQLESRRLLASDFGDEPLYYEGFPNSPQQTDELVYGPNFPNVQTYRANGRFTATATDGGGFTFGDPITLTWGFVNDGTTLPGGFVSGEVTSPSNLISFLGDIYGVSTNDTNYQDEPWFPLIQSVFDRWGELSSITYVYEPNDDGATFPSTPGSLGVRADIRIGGHTLDGNSNVLAYNVSPNFGDMVIDTDDSVYNNISTNSRRLRTIVAHEHGHGLGLNHVESNNAAFLLEPFLNVAFDGPQLDDIYGVQSLYGDALEPNDSIAEATSLGVIAVGSSVSLGSDANDTVVDISDTDFLTVDRQTDTDLFAFTTEAAADVTVTLTPVGPTYNEGPQGGSQSAYNLQTRGDLTLELLDASGVVISTSNVAGLGGTESINLVLPQSGTYHAAVTSDSTFAQFYELSINVEATPAVNIASNFGGTNLREGGSAESYQIFLGTTPEGAVEVTATADDQLEISLDAVLFSTSLNLTLADTTPVTVFVRALDDNVSEGVHTGTIEHQITATMDGTDYPLSRTIASLQPSIDDNELGNWLSAEPLAGQVFETIGNEGSLDDANDVRYFNFELLEGETLAVRAEPDSNETLVLEWVGVSAAATAASPGSPVILTSQVAPATGSYQLKVTASGATQFTMDAWRNTILEKLNGDTSPLSPLPLVAGLGLIDGTASNASIYGIIGNSDAVPGTTIELVQRNAPTEFVDLTQLPASNSFMLNNNSTLSTSISVGNDVFPAGTWKMHDNGSLTPTTGFTIPLLQDNTSIPNSGIVTAMMPFWDELDASLIYYDEILIDGIPAFVAQWQDRPHRSFGGAVTFQVQVFDDGPVLAKYAYKDVSFGNVAVDGGASATVGFQANGTTAVALSTNSPSLSDGDVVDVQFALEPDVDVYSIDWTGKAGTKVDLILDGLGSESYAAEELQIIGPDGSTVLATAVNDAVASGVATDHDLAILGFVVPTDGVYFVRLSAALQSEYAMTVAESTVIDTEPNEGPAALRTIPSEGHVIGSLDANSDVQDRYSVSLAAGETLLVRTATPLDQFASVNNTLDPGLTIIAPDQVTVVAEDADSVDGKNAEVVFTAGSAGVYTVATQAASGAGDYQLAVAIVDEVTVDLPIGTSNDVTVKLNGTDVEVLDNHNGGAVLATAPLSSSLSLTINGGNLDDVVTIDYSDGFFRFPSGISFADPAGTDRLIIKGTGGSLATYQSTGNTLGNASVLIQEGSLQSTITFTGVEPLDVTEMSAFDADGTLNVGIDTLTIGSTTASLGAIALLGITESAGTIVASNGLLVANGESVTGFGTIDTPNDIAFQVLINGSIDGASSTRPITLPGYIQGVGSLNHVSVTGTYSPGASAAQVINGSVSYAAGSDLVLEIGGTTPGSSGFDQIVHTGTASLAGNLKVELINSFAPAIGDSFTIITSTDGIGGTFAVETLPALSAGLGWDVSYSTNSVRLDVIGIDETPPTITDVKIASSSWSPTFKSFVDPIDSDGLPLPGADQLKNLTWSNLDTIIVEFSENVQQSDGSDINLGNLSLAGVNILDYEAFPGLIAVYTDGGGAGPFKLTLQLDSAAVFDAEKLLLTINDTVQDASGNLLDGEWTNSVSMVSGDATAGGDFAFRIDVLPGDTTGDDFLLGNDTDTVAMVQFTFAGGPSYDPFTDINGDGFLLGDDTDTVASVQFSFLPFGNPVAPPEAPSPSPLLASTSSSLRLLSEEGSDESWANSVDATLNELF
ncbi:beta strand repeat-containing protein [Rubripirellula reticaptiva]|uniref:Matrixin n=1 Tax=Rubripirellula reticaptiva TaxID=2528013 RepID=A0A5C6EGU1_9BACT|nr:matrixin family metalloprotease [Rubripirellula reticaptiva]TWU47694.1 Matrixin [Rubripirellula reticaptiva]